jgi:hypothetical protein
VVGRRDGSLQAWEVATGRPRDDVKGPANGLALVYAPGGRSAVTVNADGTASLWGPATGEEQAVLALDESPTVSVYAPAPAGQGPEDVLKQGVRRVAFSPDGRTLALADGVGGLAWCDVAEVRQVGEALTRGNAGGSEGGVPLATVSAGGRSFAVDGAPLPRRELLPGMPGGRIRPSAGGVRVATVEQPDGHSLLFQPEAWHYRYVLRRFLGGVGAVVFFGTAAAVGMLRPGLVPLLGGGCSTWLFVGLACLSVFWLLLWDFSVLFGAGRVRFDADLGWMTFGTTWARQQRPLTDIVAVQLLSEVVPEPPPPDDEKPPKATATTRYQMNLVLDDPDMPRLNLADHGERAWTRQAGKRLADFLAVPLIDQIQDEKQPD